MNIHAVLRECATHLLDSEDEVTVDHVIDYAYELHGDTFIEHQQQMVRSAAKTIVAKLMRDLSADDAEQLSFPGFPGLPSAIAVRGESGTYYKRHDKCNLFEVEVGRLVRSDNATAALKKLDQYDEALELLRPYMQHDPRMTVADAIRAMNGEVA